MDRKDFEETYRGMVDEQLLELACAPDDLVPDARLALTSELQRRGKTGADVESYAAAKKKGREKEPSEPWTVYNKPAGVEAGQEVNDSEVVSFMQLGPVPHDWVTIPSFAMDESIHVAQCMEEYCIPYRIIQGQGCDRQQCHLAVSGADLADCLGALKEHFGLTDEPAQAYTGECPACGMMLDAATICPGCDLNLCQDQWEARSRHPFTRYLIENGFGPKKRT